MINEIRSYIYITYFFLSTKFGLSSNFFPFSGLIQEQDPQGHLKQSVQQPKYSKYFFAKSQFTQSEQ